MRGNCFVCNCVMNTMDITHYCKHCETNWICEDCLYWCGGGCEEYVCKKSVTIAWCSRCGENQTYCKKCAITTKHWLCYETDSEKEEDASYCEDPACYQFKPCLIHRVTLKILKKEAVGNCKHPTFNF